MQKILSKNKINNLLKELDKTKCYCSPCLKKDGIITELKIDPKNSNYIIPPDCGHYNSHFYKLIFIEERNQWCSTKGSRLDQPIHKNPEFFEHECPKCGLKFKNKSSIYTCPNPNCDYSNKGLIHHVCSNPDCKYEEDTKGNNWICPKCGDKSNINKYTHKCSNPECNYEESNEIPNNVWKCPKCNSMKENKTICPDCGKEIFYTGTTWTCPNCNINNKGLIHHICSNPECKYEEDTKGSSWTCPKCGNNDNVTKFHHICGNIKCGYEEDNTQPVNNWICPKCNWLNNNHVHKIYTISDHFTGSDPMTRLKYCPSCNDETPHAIDGKENFLYCRVCRGERIYDFYENKYIKIEYFEENELKISQNMNIINNFNNLNYEDYDSIYRISYKNSISFLEACKIKEKIILYEKEKENDYKLLDEYNISRKRLNFYRNIAKSKNYKNLKEYISTFVWCDHCQQYEDPEYNSIPNHWNKNETFEFYLLRIWKENHKEEVKFLEKNIIGFNKLLDGKIHCGIYMWKIDSIPFYYGQSININRRSYEHFINIIDEADYWLNIYKEMKNKNQNNKIHTLSIDFIECKENKLDNLEKELILKDKPMSQKCNGTDHIIHLEERDYNINNLSEKYKERMNII